MCQPRCARKHLKHYCTLVENSYCRMCSKPFMIWVSEPPMGAPWLWPWSVLWLWPWSSWWSCECPWCESWSWLWLWWSLVEVNGDEVAEWMEPFSVALLLPCEWLCPTVTFNDIQIPSLMDLWNAYHGRCLHHRDCGRGRGRGKQKCLINSHQIPVWRQPWAYRDAPLVARKFSWKKN